MQISKPLLPFRQNLLYKRLRFEDKPDLIETIISFNGKTCFMMDRSWNFHIKSCSPEDENYASQQFPRPSYANTRNPNFLYSVEYLDFYRYLHVQDYNYHFGEENTEYILLCYLEDAKIAFQFDSFNPLVIIDFHRPDNPIILHDVYGMYWLAAAGDCRMAWYDKEANMVFLYHYILRKRKILNFTQVNIEEMYNLKDHVLVAASKQHLEVLDYLTNNVIKSVGFVSEERPQSSVVMHHEGNLISYIDENSIHIMKTEKGKIKWESQYDLGDENQYSKYVFINQNLIAFELLHAIHIFVLDAHRFLPHTVIQHPWLGFVDSPDLKILCCERAQKKGMVIGIDFFEENRFTVSECVCTGQPNWHGYQRVSLFSLENFKSEEPLNPQPNAHSITFQLRRSVLFEDYRDPVQVIDILDETLAMFITERGRIFQVNLKNDSIKYAVELASLIKKKSIDKFFALAKNTVILVTRIGSSPYVRIVIFSLDTRRVEWDSHKLEEEREEQILFYDVIKLSPSRLFLIYSREANNRTSHLIGEISWKENGEGAKYVFSDCVMNKRDSKVAYDRLWNLEGSLVAMRHAANASCLSLLNPHEEVLRIKQKFSAEKYVTAANIHTQGILDVKSIQKDVACIQLKMKPDELVVLVYNLRTDELLNQIKTSLSMLGTIRRCYREHDCFRNMEKSVIFGYCGYYGFQNGLEFRSVQDVIAKKIDSVNEDSNNRGLRITSSNFQPFLGGDQALIYENDSHKNFICVLKSPNFKLECIRILQKAIGNKYHNYIYKDIVDMIFEAQ